MEGRNPAAQLARRLGGDGIDFPRVWCLGKDVDACGSTFTGTATVADEVTLEAAEATSAGSAALERRKKEVIFDNIYRWMLKSR